MGLKNLAQALGGMVTGGINSVENVINMQYKEYIASGDMTGVIMKRGERIMASDSQNRASKRNDHNLITSGSRIDVQRGQAMLIIDSGKVVEYCDVEGQYVYDASSAPSMFSTQKGQFWDNLKANLSEAWRQTTAGGSRLTTQRVYFINKGLIDKTMRWGCGNVLFRHSIVTPGLPPFQQSIKIKAHGYMQFAITQPIVFFNNIGSKKVGGDNDGLYTVEEAFEEGGPMYMIKSEINQAVAGGISALGTQQQMLFDEIGQHTEDVAAGIAQKYGTKWEGLYGFNIISLTFDGAPMPEEEYIEKIQALTERAAMSANANLMNYDIQKDMAAGFKAAGEKGGAAALYGMGMSMGQMGMGFGNIQNQGVPNMGYPQQQMPMQGQVPMNGQMPMQGQMGAMGMLGGAVAQQVAQPQAPTAPTAPTTPSWTCSCGTVNTGKFCMNCGSSMPDANQQQTPATPTSWTCACGTENVGKFCMNCGTKKPTVKKYKCDKCGWEPAQGAPAPKFCPECGDIFNEADTTEV